MNDGKQHQSFRCWYLSNKQEQIWVLRLKFVLFILLDMLYYLFF